MMRNSSYMPEPSDSELADDDPARASGYHHTSPRFTPSFYLDNPANRIDSLTWDMADCVPVRVAILDTELRIRALNAEWRGRDLPEGSELGLDFVQTCLRTASQADRDMVVEGLSGLRGRVSADFSATIGLRMDSALRNFALRARKLSQTPDLVVVALLDVTDKRHLADERRRMMRIVLDAEEAERKRIARELHDETVQQLAAMQLGLAGLREFGRDADFDGRCRDMEDVLRSVQKELRTLSYILHPPEIEGGLVEALGSFVHGLARRTQVNARFVDETTGLLTDEETDRALYRVAQEALINVCKHAHAQHACVSLRARDREILLEVEDDGIGIAAELCTSRSDARLGVGMAAMRERIEALAGQLEISRLERGTRVVAILPNPRLYQ